MLDEACTSGLETAPQTFFLGPRPLWPFKAANATFHPLPPGVRPISTVTDRDGDEAEADVLLVPELALTGYPPEDLVHREDFVEANIEALNRLAQASTDVAAVVGFVDRAAGPSRGSADSEIREVANGAALLSGGRVQGIYHKVLLPN